MITKETNNFFNKCDKCNGHGKIANPVFVKWFQTNPQWEKDPSNAPFFGIGDDRSIFVTCPQCNGSEIVPTSEGFILLDFISRFLRAEKRYEEREGKLVNFYR